MRMARQDGAWGRRRRDVGVSRTDTDECFLARWEDETALERE